MPRTAVATKSAACHVITLDDLNQAGDGEVPTPDDPAFRYRILAEGDSWFSLGAVPSSNLLFELRLPDSGIVLNLAYPGDTIDNMSSLARNPDLEKMIHDDRFGYKWDLILMSGGGNDLIDRAGALVRRPEGSDADDPKNWVDPTALQELIDDIHNGYRQVIATRDKPGSINAGKPIVIHTYDYPTPRNAPARFLFAGISGPWLFPVFENLKAPDDVRVAVSDYLIDQLAAGLLALGDGPQRLPNFHVVDTRHSLVPAAARDQGDSNDWLNEIHPNHRGYRKIAEKVSDEIGTLL